MILKQLNMKLDQLNLKTLIKQIPLPIPLKQIPIPFKIYAGSECLLKRININKGGYTKLYQKCIPNSRGAKLVGIDNEFALPTKIVTGSNSIKEFIEWICNNCNKIINKHFNKKLKMTIEDENNYQNSQDCWICNGKK